VSFFGFVSAARVLESGFIPHQPATTPDDTAVHWLSDPLSCVFAKNQMYRAELPRRRMGPYRVFLIASTRIIPNALIEVCTQSFVHTSIRAFLMKHQGCIRKELECRWMICAQDVHASHEYTSIFRLFHLVLPRESTGADKYVTPFP